LPIAEIGLVYGNHRSSLKKLAGWVLLGPVVINNNKVLAPLCLFRNWLPRTQPPVSMYCLCLTTWLESFFTICSMSSPWALGLSLWEVTAPYKLFLTHTHTHTQSIHKVCMIVSESIKNNQNNHHTLQQCTVQLWASCEMWGAIEKLPR
jgi:hypothetical protein